MFGLFKAKKQVVVAPSDGSLLPLDKVEDEVFSNRLAGDGLAIIPSSNTFVAPVAGVVSKIFSTNHAFAITTTNGLEVLVHIGLDTVSLQGEGFKRLAEEGQTVTVGQPIISADLEFLKLSGKDIVTPIVVNAQKEPSIVTDSIHIVREGERIMEVTLK